tara:strand:- start:65 stop:571 length:507 start_codon:yes stop_codon:yes gene_type:complete
MKKINILKAIIDFIWIIAVPITAPLTIFFIIFIILKGETSIDLDILGIELNLKSFLARILIALLAINLLLQIYSLHIFRKTLRYFQQVKIFDDFIIIAFQKIGTLLIFSGISTLVIGFVSRIYFKSEVSISLGFNPYLLIIGLGLFFQILSEIFKIAKHQKQENDLTI